MTSTTITLTVIAWAAPPEEPSKEPLADPPEWKYTVVTTAELGRLASFVRDRRIALELCPTSNVQTGAAPSIAEHPIGLLRALNFRVTVNTDNRLMSGVTLSSELHALTEAFGYGWADLQWLTINAAKSAFVHFDERLDLINTIIKPGYAALV